MKQYSITVSSDAPVQERLPIDEHYQHAVIGWMEVDEQFFKMIVERVDSSWFMDQKDVLAFKLYQKFYKRTGHMVPQPYFDEELSGDLKACIEYREQEPNVRNAIRTAIMNGKNARNNATKKKVEDELETWLKGRLFHKLVHDSTGLYNKGQLDECFAAVRSGIDKIDEATFGAGTKEDLHLPKSLHENQKEIEGVLSFGATIVDERLIESNGKKPAGGLLPGDTTILLAPVNIGKTTTMLTVAAYNVAMGKKVLLTTHEGRAVDIKLKFWCSLLKCKRSDLDELWATNATVDGHDMKWWQNQVDKYLTYVALYGKNIEETIGVVRSLHDRELNKPNEKPNQPGQGFQLWVDDYPGTITTIQAGQGKLSRRERDEIVYGQVVDLAGELKFHALCAIQSNREGARINKGTSKDHKNRLLTMEDVSESYGPMMRATNVISINRDPQSAQKGLVTFFVCKSRSTRTGIAITCRSRYDLACTHANTGAKLYNGQEWGTSGFSYEGTESMAEKAEGFLQIHGDSEVPKGELWEAMSAA